MESAPKPDFAKGFPIANVPDGGMVQGTQAGEELVLARRGSNLFAFAAHCTHYGGPLAEGLMVGETVRCPLHHACFSLRTGEALHAPAFDPIACWKVEQVGDTVFVREKLASPPAKSPPRSSGSQSVPASVVIVGGGAAGLAAADMLRREGYDGTLTLISADESAPYDRPNLSKDFLAGTASEEWIPLRSPDYYRDQRITLVLGSRVASLDVPKKQVVTEKNQAYAFDALLLATGADPIRIPIEGARDSQVYYLRTFADSRAIIAKAASAKRVVVVGASFIALEVAASLRAREIEVHVVAPDKIPFEKVLGAELGAFLRSLHESHGVVFHLEQTVRRVDGRTITLSGGSTLDADFLVLGVGVRPSLGLAERAGLQLDRGIAVNEYLETSAPGIFAAGDNARWPDPHSGDRIRIEHWVVAERQGQVAARNMLGRQEKFQVAPFFWSQHYDLTINYVGHAEKWDAIEMDGDLQQKNCAVKYKQGGRLLAVATIGRNLQSLQAELDLESA